MNYKEKRIIYKLICEADCLMRKLGIAGVRIDDISLEGIKKFVYVLKELDKNWDDLVW